MPINDADQCRCTASGAGVTAGCPERVHPIAVGHIAGRRQRGSSEQGAWLIPPGAVLRSALSMQSLGRVSK